MVRKGTARVYPGTVSGRQKMTVVARSAMYAISTITTNSSRNGESERFTNQSF